MTTSIHVASHDWEYLIHGTGEPLLFLNGGTRFIDTAIPYIHLFSDTYRIVSISYAPVTHMKDVVSGVLGVLNSLGIDQTYVLGQSYGGLVAQALVRTAPTRVQKLILSCTGGPGLVTTRMMVLMRFAEMALPLIPEGVLLPRVQQQFQTLLRVPTAQQQEWQERLKQLFIERMTKRHIVSHFRTTFDALRSVVNEPMPDWSGAMLLLFSDDDPTTTISRRAQMQRAYPHAAVHMFHSAGHTPALSQPEEYKRVVTRFLGTYAAEENSSVSE